METSKGVNRIADILKRGRNKIDQDPSFLKRVVKNWSFNRQVKPIEKYYQNNLSAKLFKSFKDPNIIKKVEYNRSLGNLANQLYPQFI